MTRIGILSFHGAHNYGSMLQNYALQKALKSLSTNIEPITINLRNASQDDMYNIFKPFREYSDKRRYIFKIIMYPWRSGIIAKQRLFEHFLSKNIALSEKATTSDEIKSLDEMDAYIVGSDQIWNFTAHDFDWAYFLDFIPSESKSLRIAYAPSMGPSPSVETLSNSEKDKAKNLLNRFNAISVREKKTAEVVKKLGQLDNEPDVCPDPTLLLSHEEWASLISKEKTSKEGKYIFLYNPYYLKDVYQQAHILSELTKLPVVVSNLAPLTILPSRSFEKKLETGPKEFLNLVSNAEYVIGRSFHLAVFAMIFNKKFIAVNGMSDSRLGNLLSQLDMKDCATIDDNLSDVLDKINHLNYSKCNQFLNELRFKGLEFLRKNINPVIS